MLPIKKTWAQLTAAGSTAALTVRGVHDHTFEVTVGAKETSVDVRAECRMTGTTLWANMDDSGGDTQYTANGTYQLKKSNFTCDEVRFTFVSEVGGTAVTLDVKYKGERN